MDKQRDNKICSCIVALHKHDACNDDVADLVLANLIFLPLLPLQPAGNLFCGALFHSRERALTNTLRWCTGRRRALQQQQQRQCTNQMKLCAAAATSLPKKPWRARVALSRVLTCAHAAAYRYVLFAADVLAAASVHTHTHSERARAIMRKKKLTVGRPAGWLAAHRPSARGQKSACAFLIQASLSCVWRQLAFLMMKCAVQSIAARQQCIQNSALFRVSIQRLVLLLARARTGACTRREREREVRVRINKWKPGRSVGLLFAAHTAILLLPLCVRRKRRCCCCCRLCVRRHLCCCCNGAHLPLSPQAIVASEQQQHKQEL